jgi:hypothetical protein
MAAPEPILVGRHGPVLQGMWRHVDTCSALCLDLKLVYGGTRSVGYRQWPPGPPLETLRTHRWGQHIFFLTYFF